MFSCKMAYFFSDLDVDCGPLRNPEHGTVSTSSSTTFGQLASYQCDMGFVLVGPRIRACTDMGNWSGSQPTCKVKGRSFDVELRNYK